MTLKMLNTIWLYFSRLSMAIRRRLSSPLLEREMDTLTRAEIRRLYSWHIRRVIVQVALIGIIGGMLVGIAIGITIVSLKRAF